MLSDRCLSVCPVLSILSVTLVYCGQTVGRIKIKLGVQVSLGPGHTVLDGHPALPPPKGADPPIFGPYLLWPNGWMDQDATWYGGRPWSRLHCARLGLSSPFQKGDGAPAQFSAHFYCGQTAWCINIYMPLGMEVGLSPGEFVLDGDPAALPKKGTAPSPILRVEVENFEIGPEVFGALPVIVSLNSR